MAITTLDGLLAGFQPMVPFRKTYTPPAASVYASVWKATGYPAAGATPPAFGAGSGYECSRTTTGAIPFANPSSGGTKLARVSCVSTGVAEIILYDRLWACSGFDTTVTTEQNITTPGTIPTGRDKNGATLGDGVELWLEVYTTTGASASTWTVSYTNEAGTAGQSATYVHSVALAAGRMVPVTLAAGDHGVRAVKSLTVGSTTGTAGDVGITLVRRIATFPLPGAGQNYASDGLSGGLPAIYDNSCLAFIEASSVGTSKSLNGSLLWSQG